MPPYKDLGLSDLYARGSIQVSTSHSNKIVYMFQFSQTEIESELYCSCTTSFPYITSSAATACTQSVWEVKRLIVTSHNSNLIEFEVELQRGYITWRLFSGCIV